MGIAHPQLSKAVLNLLAQQHSYLVVLDIFKDGAEGHGHSELSSSDSQGGASGENKLPPSCSLHEARVPTDTHPPGCGRSN